MRRRRGNVMIYREDGLEINKSQKVEKCKNKSVFGQLQALERQSGGRDRKKRVTGRFKVDGEEGCTGRQQCTNGTIPVPLLPASVYPLVEALSPLIR